MGLYLGIMKYLGIRNPNTYDILRSSKMYVQPTPARNTMERNINIILIYSRVVSRIYDIQYDIYWYLIYEKNNI